MWFIGWKGRELNGWVKARIHILHILHTDLCCERCDKYDRCEWGWPLGFLGRELGWDGLVWIGWCMQASGLGNILAPEIAVARGRCKEVPAGLRESRVVGWCDVMCDRGYIG